MSAVLTAGCGSSSALSHQPERSSRIAPVPALVGNSPVGWEAMHRALAELSGRQALEEIILDRALVKKMKSASLALTAEMIQQERDLLAESLSASGTNLESIRKDRGLGPVRLDAFVRRNAMLRALVGDPPAPDETELRHAFEIRHSPRRVCRVLITANASQAGEIRERLLTISDPSGLEWAFAAEAFEHSTDASAAAGGFIGAVHPLDGFLPAAVRSAILSTPDGEISVVVLTASGAVIVMPVRTTTGDGLKFEEVVESLTEELVHQKQRLAMDELARSILRETVAVILDPSLKWSWDR